MKHHSSRLYHPKNYSSIGSHSLPHSSRTLNDSWGIKDDRATAFLHSSLSSAFRRASSNPKHVHPDNFVFPFFCLVFLLRPCAMPCMIIFASHVVLVTAEKLYHCEMRTRDLNYGKPTAYIVEGGTGAGDIGQSYNIAARGRFDPEEDKSTKTFSMDGTVSILVAQGLLVLCMCLF